VAAGLSDCRQSLGVEIVILRTAKRLLAFNSSRIRLHQENALFAATIPSGALVLDAGAGSAPYKQLFAHARYESADFELVDKPYAKSTYVCNLEKIPVEDGRFDFVVLNQVLEHLPDPRLVLVELNRVLKPGGRMIYSGPFFYEEHEQPYDFYRYTQFGLRELFQKSGFEIEKLEWLEGYLGTVGYQLDNMARYLPSRPSDLGGGVVGFLLAPVMLLGRLLAGLSSVAFQRLDLRIKFTRRGYPKNYLAVVRKAG
jgi:SAM-dependent methyltransferase